MSELKEQIKQLKEIKQRISTLPRFKASHCVVLGHEEVYLTEVAGLLNTIAENYFQDDENKSLLEKVEQLIREKDVVLEEQATADANLRAELVKEHDSLALTIQGALKENSKESHAFSYFSVLKKQLKDSDLALLTVVLTNSEIPFEEDNKRIVFKTMTDSFKDTREELTRIAIDEEKTSLLNIMKDFCQKSMIDFTSQKAPLELIDI